ARANAKAARLDPENHKTVQEIQAEKLEKQVAEKLKIADTPKKQQKQQQAANEESDLDEDKDEDAGMSGMTFDLDDKRTQAALVVEEAQPTEIKPMAASGSITELRQRLQERIDALLEKRMTRRKKSKEMQAKAKKSGNPAQEQVLGSKTPSALTDAPGAGKGSGSGEVKESIFFGKLSAEPPRRSRQQLIKAEGKKKELAELKKTDSAKADVIEEKDRWSKALNQAKGEKVRDDATLLRKTVRRMEQKKSKSAREWTDRKEHVDTRMKERTQKRDANLKARVDTIKMKKQGKSKKAIERVLKGGKAGGITKKPALGPLPAASPSRADSRRARLAGPRRGLDSRARRVARKWKMAPLALYSFPLV
ncbi:surfeit locus protein 6-domain-containing protein, partial [Kickxella alabastrina]|uniref:surfeit locus protein 6-domain-containing protein n=1 Tax=Kickxella alabastrina TaxID=61397 RepID=UPI00221EDE6B